MDQLDREFEERTGMLSTAKGNQKERTIFRKGVEFGKESKQEELETELSQAKQIIEKDKMKNSDLILKEIIRWLNEGAKISTLQKGSVRVNEEGQISGLCVEGADAVFSITKGEKDYD